MIGRMVPGRKLLSVLTSTIMAAGMLSGCIGPTSVMESTPPGRYDIGIEMDPPTLLPPQLSTLTFFALDTQTGKPVTSFNRFMGAAAHHILVSRDLLTFRHSTAESPLEDKISVLTYFPRVGTYRSFMRFQPAGDTMQEFVSTITAGDPTEHADLVEDAARAKQSGGLRIELVKTDEPYKAGEPSQLVFQVTQRGEPVEGLWPVHGSPGHLWIIDSEAELLAHQPARAAGNRLLPTTTPTPGTPIARNTRPAGQQATASVPAATAVTPVPTFAPDVQAGLATITANPRPTLAPVQQTAQSSIIGTPLVRPEIGYGPNLIFEHKFAEPGLYKMWLELFYEGQPAQVEFVVRVVE